MKPNAKNLTRIWNAFGYSWDGLKSIIKTEAAFRQELFLFAILLPIALIINVTIIEKLLLISSLFIILLMEIANSSIEAVVDRISDDYHILSKKAKDIGSLLVLVAFLHATIVWSVILFNYFC